MTPNWISECGTVALYLGDCRDILPTIAAGSIDAVVTDPPLAQPRLFAESPRRAEQLSIAHGME